MAQVAIAWSLSKDGVTAPIVGTTNLNNLKDIIGRHFFVTSTFRRSSWYVTQRVCMYNWQKKKSNLWKSLTNPKPSLVTPKQQWIVVYKYGCYRPQVVLFVKDLLFIPMLQGDLNSIQYSVFVASSADQNIQVSHRTYEHPSFSFAFCMNIYHDSLTVLTTRSNSLSVGIRF